MTISQLDEADRRHYTAVFEDVFPTAINPIQLGYDMTNQVTKMSVTFCYRRWRSLTQTVAEKPLMKRSENQLELQRTAPAVSNRARVGGVAGV
jgi:hypothetical protein